MIVEPGSAEWYYEKFPGFYNNQCYEILERWSNGVPAEDRDTVLKVLACPQRRPGDTPPSTKSTGSSSPEPFKDKDPSKKNKKKTCGRRKRKWQSSALQEEVIPSTNSLSTANIVTQEQDTTRALPFGTTYSLISEVSAFVN